MTAIGDLVAAGRTSDVYEFGRGSVVKVPRPQVPEHWPEMEARFTAAVHQVGVRAPEVRGLVDIEGRRSIVFEHIHGPSMWQLMLSVPSSVRSLAADLAATHRSIHSAGIPKGIPSLVERLSNKVAEVDQLGPAGRDEATRLMSSMPRGAALLHGDLHPANVLMAADGPTVIDWFDAAIGHPIADIVRSSLLFRLTNTVSSASIDPTTRRRVMGSFHDAYVEQMADELAGAADSLGRWEAVVAAGRLAEGIEVDDDELLEVWRARDRPCRSRLNRGLSATGGCDESTK